MTKSKIRLFLAEDHHVMRAALHSMLSNEPDLEVIGEAADGRRLLDEVQRLQPDLLVMDAEMPEHKPVQAVEWLQEHCPDVKILVLSAHVKRAYVVGLFRAGVAAYVLKDDAAQSLLQAIRKVMRGEQWVSPKAAAILVELLRQSEQERIAQLTERELDVLRLLALGYSNQAIADKLVLSEHTVRTHVHHIYNKLGVETRVEAVLFALSHDLVPLQAVHDIFADRLENNHIGS